MRTEIQFPELREEQIITQYAQIRPHREGGLRIQRQSLGGKVVIHNYGHGGAGISLAPGSSLEAVNLSLDLLKPNSQVAIIGSGINGLMTAHHIFEHEPSCNVTIYAQQVASYCNKNNDCLITSQISPGFWLPYSYGQKDEKKHEERAHFNFIWYKKLGETEQYKAYIKEVDYFDLSDQQELNPVTQYITDDIRPTLKPVEVVINNKTKIKGSTFKTLKIDLQPFLLIFKAELINKGLKIVQRKITKESLYEMKEGLIFNCSGLGSRQLFDDPNMLARKGHIIEFKNLKPQKYNYICRVNVGNRKICFYMHDSRILCGLTVHIDESRGIDRQTIKQIKQIKRLVRQKWGLEPIKPKL